MAGRILRLKMDEDQVSRTQVSMPAPTDASRAWALAAFGKLRCEPLAVLYRLALAAGPTRVAPISVRALAQTLGLGRDTVKCCIAQLSRIGLVRRMGPRAWELVVDPMHPDPTALELTWAGPSGPVQVNSDVAGSMPAVGSSSQDRVGATEKPPPAEAKTKKRRGPKAARGERRREPDKDVAHSPEEREIIREFRKAYLTHADPGYKGFTPYINKTEVESAGRLLKKHGRELILKVIDWTVKHKETPRAGSRWTGWSGVIKSLSNLLEHFATLEQKMRFAQAKPERPTFLGHVMDLDAPGEGGDGDGR